MLNERKWAELVINKMEMELRELALKIHANPEIGLKEHTACKWQCDLLRKYGFEVESPYAGYETAYKAVYRGSKPGPKIAMLAEYDALPGLGHGCGHNLIAMVSVGSGIGMRTLADEFGAEIYVIGTPAEENMGAKVQMAEQGIFDEMDVVMMSHPSAMFADCSDTMAINAYRIAFRGKTAHAAAAPEEGRNALDAMINLFNMINALRQQTKPDARIHGIITKGGEAPNIIPDYTESLFYVRANKSVYLQELCERVESCVKGAALGAGVEYEIEFAENNFKDTCSNKVLAELNAEQMEKMGISVHRMAGKHLPASSDLGDVSYRCPAIQSSFDITDGKGYGPHTCEFALCASSEFAIQSGFSVIKGFLMTARELMTEPSYLRDIKKEFQEMIGSI